MKTIQTKTNASNVELTISTFKELTYFIKDNLGDWKITGNLDSLPYELHEAVSNSKTKSKLKKIKKRIFFLKRKVSISKLNKLFEEINSQIIVDISDKEKWELTHTLLKHFGGTISEVGKDAHEPDA